MKQERAAMKRSSPSVPAGGADVRREEFEAQALPHLRAMHNLALRLTRNEGDAQDLVQDTYLRAYRFFHRFETGTNIRAWLFRILKNQFLNRVQQHRLETGSVDLDATLASGTSGDSAFPHLPRLNPEEAVMASITSSEVKEALAELPAEYRPVVTLALVDEKSYKDISKTLHIPMGTVMSRLHRGRRILQSRLYDYVAHRHLVGREALAEAAGSRREVSH
jgi:RNA polymerase sigma-70 factor (ECF subfamily)